MTFRFTTRDASLALASAAPRTARELSVWEADRLAKLFEWFGVEFHLVDAATGELAHCAFDQPQGDWSVRSQVCRVLAHHGRAEFIAEDSPLLVLAIPMETPHGMLVAVATFVERTKSEPDRTSLATTLGMEPDDAARWLEEQMRWKADLLLAMGQLAADRMSSDERVRTLQKEAHDLSIHLSKTYEEISLLYRLTQNLKLSSQDEELGSLALEWLAEVLPVESLAIQLQPSGRIGAPHGDVRTQPVFLKFGPCPIDSDELAQLIDHLQPKPGERPLIVNPPSTTDAHWPWPSVRQLIIVSLCEGDNCFGWMVACNHVNGEEFGTVEASLLSSVAAILGIHSGNSELYQQQREFFAGVVCALTSAIDAKDPYTCGHSDRVARVAVKLADELGLDRKQIDTIYLSGLLHDVGKIGIDDSVLRKPGKLTEAEYAHIKTHAEIGYRILRDLKQLDDVLPVVLHHHEQWDGQGYPNGLAGEAIPILARIVAVADSFDAMSSDRPYRSGMAGEEIDAILRKGSGKQWDAGVIEAFFRVREEIRDIADASARSLTLDSRDCT